jgi:hypothetical protein
MDPDCSFIPLFIFVLYLSPFLSLYPFQPRSNSTLLWSWKNSTQPDCWLEEFTYPDIPDISHFKYGLYVFWQ